MATMKVESTPPAPPPPAEDLSRLSLAGPENPPPFSSSTAEEAAEAAGGDKEEEEEQDSIPGIAFLNYTDERDLAAVMRLVGKDLSEPYSIFTYRYFLHRFPDLCILAVPAGGGEPIGCVVCKVDEEGGGGGGAGGLPLADPPSSGGDGDGDGDGGAGGAAAKGEGGGDGGGGTGAAATESAETGGETAAAAAAASASPSTSADRPPPPTATTLSGYMAMLAVDNTRRKSGIGTALARRAVRRMRERGCNSVSLETEVANGAAIRLYEDRLGFVREERLVRYYLNWGDAYRLRLWFD